MYKNEGLNIIHNKLKEQGKEIDFKDIDDIEPVFQVGALCSKLGIDVVFTSKKIFTFMVRRDGIFCDKNNTIYINDKLPATINLLTIANIIGHYILDIPIIRNGYKLECEANDFAMNLLMPEYKFFEIFQKYSGDIRKIASFFGVSFDVCQVRAFNLGLIYYL
jgi:Zn-dependent peptidase ImmA (M78 family)